MPPTSVPASLGNLLIEMTTGMVEQQKRLDGDYLERLEAFGLVWEAAQGTGYERLVEALKPSAMVLSGTEIEMQLRFARSTEREFSLRVQHLDAGFMRRYRYSQFTQNSLQLKLERIPLEHAARRNPNS